MSVKKKPGIPPYEAFGDELSPGVALLQAASILDITAQYAVESRDTDTLTNCSVLWMQLGERLLNGGRLGTPEADDDDDEVSLESEPRQPVGFAGTNTEKEIEVDE